MELMVEKISTGCAGLDEVLMGGIPANTITVLMGAPGTRQDYSGRATRFRQRDSGSAGPLSHHALRTNGKNSGTRSDP